jgi:hypothetical protein
VFGEMSKENFFLFTETFSFPISSLAKLEGIKSTRVRQPRNALDLIHEAKADSHFQN